MIYTEEERKPQIWFCGGHFINDIYTGFLNPVMPFIAEQVRISMPVAAVILSCSHIFSSILQPFFGFFADNTKKRALIFWGLIMTALFISFVPVIPNLSGMILFIMLGSLGSSLFHPQSLGLISRFSKTDAVKNMGIFIACGTLGYSMGPLFSSAVAQYFGLNKMPYLSLLGVCWAFLMFKMVPKFSGEINKKMKIDFVNAIKRILSNRKLNILNGIAMLKSLMTTSCSILLPFLWKSQGYTKLQIGMALFTFLFAGGIASLLSPKLEKKIGTKNVFYFSMITTLPLMILFVMSYKILPVLSFIIFAITGFVTMFATPVTMNIAQNIIPEYKSIIGGFINGFSWGVVAIIMSIVAFIAQQTSIPLVMVIISVIPALFSFTVKFLFQEQNIN